VVLGGSLARLLTARILSDHFDRVTLIERDAYLETTETRRGIPQANHVHGLLARGREILEELFPGLQDELVAAGAPLLDMANEIAWFTPKGWGVRFPSDLMVLAFTRPLLDLHVRRRLATNTKVEILDNTDVVRLLPDSTENRLAGVLICPRVSETDRRVAQELRADLVVDTTGRASRAPRWLEDIGYEAPEEICVDAHLAYASRQYYMDHVVQLATQSVVVRKVLLQAFNMLIPPTALFQPRILFRVLVQVFKPAPRTAERPERKRTVFKQREAS
jgi:hypothetical protein